MSEAKTIQEVFFLRCMACLSIVLLHAIDRIYGHVNTVPELITLLLTFGTPAFVFISEFVISRSYPIHTPRKFWEKRLKYILLPYVFFGIFYALSKAIEDWLFQQASFFQTFFTLVWRHLLIGDFQGYFILIIFQFYLLHMLFQRYIHRFDPKWVIAISLIVNILYLGIFNFTEIPNTPVLQYIWLQGHWLLFLGWIFYFSVAYYCGRNYQRFIQWLVKRQFWIYLFTLIYSLIPLVLTYKDILVVHSSKRIDMIFFTLSMILTLYLLAHKIKNIPYSIVRISKYSFGIYLLHPFFMGVMIIGISKIPLLNHSMLGMIFLFIGSIGLSIITTYLLNKVPGGAFFIGKIGIGSRPDKSVSLTQVNV